MTEKALEEIRELLALTADILTDLFQSGFSTVHDSTLKDLDRGAAAAAQYGMETLSGMLSDLKNRLESRRHQAGSPGGISEICDIYGTVNQYLYICRKRLEIDEAAYRINQKGD